MNKNKIIFNLMIVFLLSFVLFKVVIYATKYKSVSEDGLIIDGSFLHSTEEEYWKTCIVYYSLAEENSDNSSNIKSVNVNCDIKGFVLPENNIKKIYRIEFKRFGEHADWSWMVDGYSLGDLNGIKRIYIDIAKWSDVVPNGGFSILNISKQGSW